MFGWGDHGTQRASPQATAAREPAAAGGRASRSVHESHRASWQVERPVGKEEADQSRSRSRDADSR